jgi:DNA-damage-inducible protein J
MLYCSQQNVSDAIVLMSHNVATSIVSATMASNDVVRARIDGQIKEAATVVLAEMGLSISDAIRMLLTRIAADKALPLTSIVCRPILIGRHHKVALRQGPQIVSLNSRDQE